MSENNELTREQVEEILTRTLVDTDYDVLMAHDAALRERLAEAERQRDAHADLASERRRELQARDATIVGLTKKYHILLEFFDQHSGTPCEQVRHLQAIEEKDATIARLERERDVAKKALLLSCSDQREYLECQPNCDSYGHDDKCEVANPGIAFKRLEQQLAALTTERDHLQAAFAKELDENQKWMNMIHERDTQLVHVIAERDRYRDTVNEYRCRVSGDGRSIDVLKMIGDRDATIAELYENIDIYDKRQKILLAEIARLEAQLASMVQPSHE